MTYTSLSTTLQDILLYNFEQLGKFILILIILGGALFYRLYWKPYVQQETIFISLGILRLLWNQLSIVLLYTSPFFIFFLSPEYGLYDLFLIIISFLTIGILLFSVFIVIDMFKIGFLGILSRVGVNVDPQVTKFFNKKVKGGDRWK